MEINRAKQKADRFISGDPFSSPGCRVPCLNPREESCLIYRLFGGYKTTSISKKKSGQKFWVIGFIDKIEKKFLAKILSMREKADDISHQP